VMLSQIATAYYFLHFLVILPIVSSVERTEPLPTSITAAVLGSDGADKEVVKGEAAEPLAV
jgi:ubiquinol-cytochrome c reductase cytochrome b subunit